MSTENDVDAQIAKASTAMDKVSTIRKSIHRGKTKKKSTKLLFGQYYGIPELLGFNEILWEKKNFTETMLGWCVLFWTKLGNSNLQKSCRMFIYFRFRKSKKGKKDIPDSA